MRTVRVREGVGGERSRVREVADGGGTRSGAGRRSGRRGCVCRRGREAEARELGEIDPCLGSRISIFGKVEVFGPNLEKYLWGSLLASVCTYCAPLHIYPYRPLLSRDARWAGPNRSALEQTRYARSDPQSCVHNILRVISDRWDAQVRIMPAFLVHLYTGSHCTRGSAVQHTIAVRAFEDTIVPAV